MVNTFPYISMNEQIHIEESLLSCIYFWNRFLLTFAVFSSTSKMPQTHTNIQNLGQFLEEGLHAVDLHACPLKLEIYKRRFIHPVTEFEQKSGYNSTCISKSNLPSAWIPNQSSSQSEIQWLKWCELCTLTISTNGIVIL